MKRSELKYAVGWAAVVMAVTCLPYAVVWFFCPLQTEFPLILFNSDDHGVYLAWMRQAHDGAVLFRNLFTTQPQHGVYLQAYFLLLGVLARLTRLDLAVVYHLGRVVFGALTLVLVYRLAAFCYPDELRRRCAFWCAAVGGGVGWLFWTDEIVQTAPVDVWQPEALTFATLYTNGLFCVSLALMLGVVVCLLLAERQGWRWAVWAGLCGLLLGNTHSYDTIHLAAAWGGYLAARGVVERRVPWHSLRMALVAALVAAPSVGYMAWLYRTEPVFRLRADTPTLTGDFAKYLWGYGLLLPLAAAGAVLLWRGRKDSAGGPAPQVLLPVWAVAGLLVIYLPFAFQRKLIMGTHLPLAVLAGGGAAALAEWACRNRPRWVGVTAALPVLALAPSHVLYMLRDVRVARLENRTSTGAHPAYWRADVMETLRWAGTSTPRTAALLTWPQNGVLAPALSGRAVYAGHWGETPAFSEKMQHAYLFYWGEWSPAERLRFLQSQRITHVLRSPVEEEWVTAFGARRRHFRPFRRLEDEVFLEPVHRVGEAALFAVRAERGSERKPRSTEPAGGAPTRAVAPGSPGAP